MLQDHQLHLSVGNGGKVEVKVIYKDRVPDLLSGFSREVRRRAILGMLFPSAHEWKLLQACQGQPVWAQQTVRQHLYYERAVRINARLKRRAERRRLKVERREARRMARQQARNLTIACRHAQRWGPVIPTAERVPDQKIVTAPSRSVQAEVRMDQSEIVEKEAPVEHSVTTAAEASIPDVEKPALRSQPGLAGKLHGAGVALKAPYRTKLTMTERLAQTYDIAPVQPDPSRNVRDHSRGR